MLLLLNKMSYKKGKSETELFCEIKEAFQIFDKDNDGVITKEEEMTIMRMFGINPIEKEKEGNGSNSNNQGQDANVTEEQVQQQEIPIENQTVEFNEFFDNIHHRISEAQNDEEILADIDPISLKKIDELTHELRISKEQISEELINKIIMDAKPDDKKFIVHKNYIKLMLNKS